MATVNLGPLSLSLTLAVSILAFLLLLFGSRLADRKLHTNIESALWKTVLAALVAGRAVFVYSYSETYLQQPLSIVDIRDGGFSVMAAVITGVLATLWFIWRHTLSRKIAITSLVAGLSAVGMIYAASVLLNPEKPVVADVMMTTLEGQVIPIDQFHDKPAVINLWASWCPPCRREMPALQEGQNSNPDIHFVFANQGEAAAIVDAYLHQEGLALENVLLDEQGDLAQLVKSRGLPTTLFLDRQGQLVDVRLGELSSATLQDRLNALRSTATLMHSSKE